MTSTPELKPWVGPAIADTPNKRIVARLITEVYNSNDEAAIRELIDIGMRNHTLPETNNGQEQFVHVIRWVHSIFGDLSWTIDDLIDDGNSVVFRGSMSGIHKASFMGIPATGRRVTMEHIEIFRIKDGRITERWAQRDQLSMLAQLQG